MARAYDYIVIGAGSAGCVVADGLSAQHSVLLLEAGGSDRHAEVAIPAAFSRNFKTSRDWAYHSEPEPFAYNRTLFLPRGRMLGGSSSMNAMIYNRGRPADYDAWEKMGGEGWGWGDVLPVFKMMEDNSRGADEYHGVGGPLHVTDLRSPNAFSRRFVEAAEQAGHRLNDDFNGPSQEGVGFYQVNQRRGRRWSAADAYLRPALHRPTLTVATGAMARRVVIDAGAAVGVEYAASGRIEMAFANSEVVVCAGAFGSPHLLQLSGIGDPILLEEAGIAVNLDLPDVGMHMQDHPIIGVIQRSTRAGTLDSAESYRELARWASTRRGRLSSNVAEAGGYARSSPDLEFPDLQFHFGPVYFEDHGMAPFDGHAYSLGSALVTPRSRGRVLTTNPDPSRAPKIVGNYLEDRGDVESLVIGVRMTREILAAIAFDEVRGEEMIPGPGVRDRDELERFVRERFELLYHPVGTCRMGREGESVVDARLEVWGVESLRVADASVMPVIPSANTNAATMMIGAKAVQLVLDAA